MWCNAVDWHSPDTNMTSPLYPRQRPLPSAIKRYFLAYHGSLRHSMRFTSNDQRLVVLKTSLCWATRQPADATWVKGCGLWNQTCVRCIQTTTSATSSSSSSRTRLRTNSTPRVRSSNKLSFPNELQHFLQLYAPDDGRSVGRESVCRETDDRPGGQRLPLA